MIGVVQTEKMVKLTKVKKMDLRVVQSETRAIKYDPNCNSFFIMRCTMLHEYIYDALRQFGQKLVGVACGSYIYVTDSHFAN